MISDLHAKLPEDIQFYQQIIDANPSGTILIDAHDLDMPIVYVNQAFERITGYSHEEAIGKHLGFLYDDTLQQDGLEVLQSAIQEKRSCIVVFRNYRKNGSIFWNELHIIPLRDQSGQVSHFLGVHNDVTIREESKVGQPDQVIEQEEAYRLLVSGAIHGMMIFQDSKPVFANQAMSDALGYEFEEFLEFSSEDFWSKIHPHDREMVQARYHDRIAGKPVSSHYVYRMFHKDRHLIWVEAYINRIIYRNKPAVQIAIVDVTESKQLEDTLQLYRAAVEATDDLIMIVDRQYRYVLVNDVFLSYHQLKREDVIGQQVSRTLGDVVFQSLIKVRLDRSFTGEIQQFEMDFHYPGMGKRYPWVKFYPLRDGLEEIIGVVVVVRDMTERKQAEMKLLESEARARALVQAVPDLIFRLDHEGRYLDYKIDLNELDDQSGILFGKNVQDNLPPELSQLIMEYIRQTLETDKMQVFEYQLSVAQTLQDYEARMVVSGNNEVTAIVRNITERNQIRQREFDFALERARVRLLTEFIQNASHEFRTPLTTINTSAHLMLRTNDIESRLYRGNLIQDQVQRITKLLDMLLRMVSLETTAPSLTPINVSELVQRICHDFSVQSKSPRIKCSTELTLIIQGDETLLREAIEELVDNAQRFGPKDGIVTLLAGQNSEHVFITVQDAGPGIPHEKQAHIFDIFWREDVAHSSPGLGLGLPIARKITQMHHGHIDVQSEIGKGSAFHIVLPLG